MRISSLGRSAAPWHPAAAWALAASFVVFVTAGIAHGLDSGIRGGIATFLGWAIVRELAPTRLVASLLAPFAAVAFAIPADSKLLACLGVLLAARIALRSVGDPPTTLDCVGLVAFAGWLAIDPVGLPVAVVLAATCFADVPPPRMRLTGAAMLVAALVVGSVEGTLTVRNGWDDHALGAQVLLALLVAASLVLLAWPLPRRLRTRDDRGRGHLRGRRLRIARLVTVASIAAAVAWTGSSGAFALSSASAAIVAASLGPPGARRAPATRPAEEAATD